MEDIILKKAVPYEIDIVLSLLKDAAFWLKSKNIDYWQNWINPQRIYVDWIKQGFKNNEFYFACIDNLIIGCFRLQWNDEMFWEKREDQAGYIHSLTTSRKKAGSGLGKRLIDTIENYCRKNSKDFLRLDCGKHVKGLRNFYESLGFQYAGEKAVHGEQCVLYEKTI